MSDVSSLARPIAASISNTSQAQVLLHLHGHDPMILIPTPPQARAAELRAGAEPTAEEMRSLVSLAQNGYGVGFDQARWTVANLTQDQACECVLRERLIASAYRLGAEPFTDDEQQPPVRGIKWTTHGITAKVGGRCVWVRFSDGSCARFFPEDDTDPVIAAGLVVVANVGPVDREALLSAAPMLTNHLVQHGMTMLNQRRDEYFKTKGAAASEMALKRCSILIDILRLVGIEDEILFARCRV